MTERIEGMWSICLSHRRSFDPLSRLMLGTVEDRLRMRHAPPRRLVEQVRQVAAPGIAARRASLMD